MKIDGKKIANEILDEFQKQVFQLKKKGIVPHLAIILIGSDAASLAYVRQKILKANKIGIKTTLLNKEAGIKSHELRKTIEQPFGSAQGGLNNDNNVHGIIVQRPLPPHINSGLINRVIDPGKDVDAFNPKTKFNSPISMAVLAILEHVFERRGDTAEFITWLNAKKIVVIGKGETGGAPVIKTLKRLKNEPMIIDSKTQNSKLITKNADIIISAVGKPNVLNKEIIKKDVILISIGLHKGTDGKLHGDYEENKIKNIASFYTPTPGGVGPINVAMLLKNVVLASSFSG